MLIYSLQSRLCGLYYSFRRKFSSCPHYHVGSYHLLKKEDEDEILEVGELIPYIIRCIECGKGLGFLDKEFISEECRYKTNTSNDQSKENDNV